MRDHAMHSLNRARLMRGLPPLPSRRAVAEAVIREWRLSGQFPPGASEALQDAAFVRECEALDAALYPKPAPQAKPQTAARPDPDADADAVRRHVMKTSRLRALEDDRDLQAAIEAAYRARGAEPPGGAQGVSTITAYLVALAKDETAGPEKIKALLAAYPELGTEAEATRALDVVRNVAGAEEMRARLVRGDVQARRAKDKSGGRTEPEREDQKRDRESREGIQGSLEKARKTLGLDREDEGPYVADTLLRAHIAEARAELSGKPANIKLTPVAQKQADEAAERAFAKTPMREALDRAHAALGHPYENDAPGAPEPPRHDGVRGALEAAHAKLDGGSTDGD